MSDLLLDVQSASSTPSAGQIVIWPDTTAKKMAFRDDAGRAFMLAGGNSSIVAQAISAADTYLTDSDLLMPSFGLQARCRLRWDISVSKTAAGTATPIYTIRLGAARTTSDTAILVLTGPAQTAAADVAVITILATLRNTGAAGVLQGTVSMVHNLAATGFATNAAGIVEASSSTFDTTAAAGLYFGLSVNNGASGAWTVTQVQCTLEP